MTSQRGRGVTASRRPGTSVAAVPDQPDYAPDYADPPVPAFLFDLDGTLIDSVYQNVIAWRNALAKLDIDLSVWRIHRRIGSGPALTGSTPTPPNCWCTPTRSVSAT
jgi:hypothetical protein